MEWRETIPFEQSSNRDFSVPLRVAKRQKIDGPFYANLKNFPPMIPAIQQQQQSSSKESSSASETNFAAKALERRNSKKKFFDSADFWMKQPVREDSGSAVSTSVHIC